MDSHSITSLNPPFRGLITAVELHGWSLPGSLVTPPSGGFDRQVTKKTQVGKLEFAEGCEAIGFEGARPWAVESWEGSGRGIPGGSWLVTHFMMP